VNPSSRLRAVERALRKTLLTAALEDLFGGQRTLGKFGPQKVRSVFDLAGTARRASKGLLNHVGRLALYVLKIPLHVWGFDIPGLVDDNRFDRDAISEGLTLPSP
jgi:hypothetical protein